MYFTYQESIPFDSKRVYRQGRVVRVKAKTEEFALKQLPNSSFARSWILVSVFPCSHREYGSTGHCAEMSCDNYVNKHKEN